MTGLTPQDDARSVILSRADDVLQVVAKERRIGETVVADHNEAVAHLLMLAATWLDRVSQKQIDATLAAVKQEDES